MRSNVSTMVNFKGPCGGGPCINWFDKKIQIQIEQMEKPTSYGYGRKRKKKIEERKNKDNGMLEINI